MSEPSAALEAPPIDGGDLLTREPWRFDLPALCYAIAERYPGARMTFQSAPVWVRVPLSVEVATFLCLNAQE